MVPSEADKTLKGVLILTLIFWEVTNERNGQIEWNVRVVLKSWDVEIYVNVRQIPLTQMVSDMIFFWLEPLQFLVYQYTQKSRMYWKEVIISLKQF